MGWCEDVVQWDGTSNNHHRIIRGVLNSNCAISNGTTKDNYVILKTVAGGSKSMTDTSLAKGASDWTTSSETGASGWTTLSTISTTTCITSWTCTSWAWTTSTSSLGCFSYLTTRRWVLHGARNCPYSVKHFRCEPVGNTRPVRCWEDSTSVELAWTSALPMALACNGVVFFHVS